jgi:predicted enzyme related to lactoylglutathione lyase
MLASERYEGMTVQFFVPDFKAGFEFYSTLIGTEPDFQPSDEFAEWEVVPCCWIQVGRGHAMPTYPVRLCVADIAASVDRVEADLGVQCTDVIRIPGLMAFCNFKDPWGNNLGLYERLVDEEPQVTEGSLREYSLDF